MRSAIYRRVAMHDEFWVWAGVFVKTLTDPDEIFFGLVFHGYAGPDAGMHKKQIARLMR